MLNGGSILFMTLFSRIIVKRQILKHHYLACFFVIIGFMIVGYSPNIAQKDNTQDKEIATSSYVIGLSCILGYLLCHAIQGNVQELILRKKAVAVQRMIGLEGMFGLIWSFLLIMICSYIACPNKNMCDLDGPLEDPVSAVFEVFAKPGLLFFAGTAILSVLILNLVGLYLVKMVSAVYKAFFATFSIIMIWVRLQAHLDC